MRLVEGSRLSLLPTLTRTKGPVTWPPVMSLFAGVSSNSSRGGRGARQHLPRSRARQFTPQEISPAHVHPESRGRGHFCK